MPLCHDICMRFQAFGAMLRYLDSQVGRPMSLTRADNLHKEPDDIITYVLSVLTRAVNSFWLHCQLLLLFV